MGSYNRDGFDRSLFKRVMAQPLLEQGEEIELTRRWQDQGDQEALAGLIDPHLRLVVSIARKFRHYGLPLDDLLQEGVLGLMHAATRYDATRNVRFATYAQWWIRSFMTEFILRNWSLIRIGTTRSQKSLFFNLRRLRNEIDGVSGDSMSDDTVAQIARSLRVSEADVRVMEQRLAGRDSSLNVTLSDETREEKTDYLVCDDPDPEQQLAHKQSEALRSELLKAALEELGERERQIIELRRLSETPMTLEDIGRTFGISKERVRQLETRALEKIRQHVRASARAKRDAL